MFLIGCKLKNTVTYPEEIGKWLILHKIPVLSFSENGEYIFANTRALRQTMKLLPDELKGGGQE